jgi:exosortase
MVMTTQSPVLRPSGTADVPPVAFLLPLGVGLLLFAWPTLTGLAGIYRTDDNFSHGFLVPLIAVYAAWRQRHELIPALGAGRLLGAMPLVAGLAIVLFSRWYELALLPRGVIAMFMAGFGLVLTLVGLAWIAIGWQGVRRLTFPLGFLLLGLPIPSFLLHRVTLPLQQVAAAISTAALHLIGVTVQRQGSVLRLPVGDLGVDEACSGIRSLAVLTAVGLAMIHFNRPSRRGAILLLLALVPLAVLTNAVRVFLSGIFMVLGWKQLTQGGPHELLGLFTFALAIGGLAALSSLLSGPGEASSRPRSTASPKPSSGLPCGAGEAQSSEVVSGDRSASFPVPVLPPRSTLSCLANPAFAAAFLFFCAALVSFALNTHYDRLYARDLARLAERRPLTEFPSRIGPYVRIRSEELSAGEFSMLDPSELNIGTYLGPDGRQFSVTILYWNPPEGRPSRRPDLLKRPHSPDWCFPAAGWNRLSRWDGTCSPAVFPGEQGRVRVFERDQQTMVVLFWTGVTAARTDAPDQIFQRLSDMAHSWSNPPLANLHTVTIGTLADARDPSAAREAALAMARELAKILPDYGVGLRR